jgi:hypothetical protein
VSEYCLCVGLLTQYLVAQALFRHALGTVVGRVIPVWDGALLCVKYCLCVGLLTQYLVAQALFRHALGVQL